MKEEFYSFSSSHLERTSLCSNRKSLCSYRFRQKGVLRRSGLTAFKISLWTLGLEIHSLQSQMCFAHFRSYQLRDKPLASWSRDHVLVKSNVFYAFQVFWPTRFLFGHLVLRSTSRKVKCICRMVLFSLAAWSCNPSLVKSNVFCFFWGLMALRFLSDLLASEFDAGVRAPALGRSGFCPSRSSGFASHRCSLL